MNDIAFKVIIKNDGIDDVIFKTIMLKGEKGDKGDAGETEIDDSTTSATKTWSSQKIDSMIAQTETIEDVAIASFSDGADDVPVSELTVEIEAVQDLHGYDKPWVGGAGKNKLPLAVDGIKALNTNGSWSGNTYTLYGATCEILTDTNSNVVGVKVNGTPTQNLSLIVGTVSLEENYIVNGCPMGGSYNSSYSIWAVSTSPYMESVDAGTGVTITNNYTREIRIRIVNGYTANNLLFYPMIRLATETDATFEPYSNICPITGFDSGVVTVTDNDQITNTYTFAFGQTVYGGHFDNKGNLVVTHSFIASYTGETINEPWESSMDNYVPNTIPSAGAQVKYPLTNPIPLSITSKDVRTLLGNNNIFADTGNINKLVYFKTGSEAVARMIEAYMRASN